MSYQRLWEYERGALWARELAEPSTATAPTHATATLSETGPDAAESLAVAMGLDGQDEIRRRFAAGSRCFVARVGGVIAGYGWVSQGEERIGELERVMRMRPGEAYIWDCATLPPFRRQGIYNALLTHIVATLQREGYRRLWIGASLQNRPSLDAFAYAGFQPAITIVYVRFLRVSRAWLVGAPTAPAALVADARWSLAIEREARAPAHV